jgi:hypothetical protein
VLQGTKTGQSTEEARTSQNSVKRKLNFRESPKGEVRGILIPCTLVNKGRDEGPEYLDPPLHTGTVRMCWQGAALLLEESALGG